MALSYNNNLRLKKFRFILLELGNGYFDFDPEQFGKLGIQQLIQRAPVPMVNPQTSALVVIVPLGPAFSQLRQFSFP